jgi:hypothetical protein
MTEKKAGRTSAGARWPTTEPFRPGECRDFDCGEAARRIYDNIKERMRRRFEETDDAEERGEADTGRDP